MNIPNGLTLKVQNRQRTTRALGNVILNGREIENVHFKTTKELRKAIRLQRKHEILIQGEIPADVLALLELPEEEREPEHEDAPSGLFYRDEFIRFSETIDGKIAGKADQKQVNEVAQEVKTATVKLAEESQRIDNVIATAGDGTIPTELTDIRVLNGKTYTTAGQAIRALSKGEALQDGSVSPEKSTFLEVGKNKFNKETVLAGYRLSGGASIQADDLYCLSDFIPVKPNTSYRRKHSGLPTFLFDESHELISYTTTGSFDTQEAQYVRLNVLKTLVETEQLEIGTESTDYENYKLVLKNHAESKEVREAKISEPLGMEFPTLQERLNYNDRKIDTLSKNGITLDGVEMTNLAVNGDFSDGINGWDVRDGVQFSITDKTLIASMVSESIKSNWQIRKTVDGYNEGDLYYLSIQIQPIHETDFTLMIGGNFSSFITAPAEEWSAISSIASATGTDWRIYANTLNYSVGDEIRFKNMNVVNLTEIFGAGNEPSKEELDYIISKHGYISGTEFVTTTDNKKKIIGVVESELKSFDSTAFTSHLHDEEVLFLGDSITGNAMEYDYPSIVAERTGIKDHNAGFGGSRAGQHDAADFNRFSFYNLANCIADEDFSSLHLPFLGERPTPYTKRIEVLENVDFTKLKILCVAYGANDWRTNTPDDEVDPYSTNSFKGSLRYGLKTILEKYPHLQVMVISPFYRFFPENEPVTDSDDVPDTVNKWMMSEYVKSAEEIAKEFKVPFLDVYYELGINKYTRWQYFSGTDGTHHDPRGRELIGNVIASKMLSVY